MFVHSHPVKVPFPPSCLLVLGMSFFPHTFTFSLPLQMPPYRFHILHWLTSSLKERAHLMYFRPHSQQHLGPDLLTDWYLPNDVEDRMNNLICSFDKTEWSYTGETYQLLHHLLPETKFFFPFARVE